MENELKLSICLIVISFLIGAYAYNLLPEKVASHWGLSGEVNGYMPRFLGAFFMPFLLVGLFLLFVVIPKIDPLKANIDKFKQDYYQFILVIIIFMFLVYIQSILWNLGIQISFNATMPVLLCVLFVYLGTLLEKSKRNWFIGIRTPWTLSSDEVWDKTHKFGATVFRIAGVLMLSALFVPAYTFLIVIGLVLIAVLGTVVYSYLEYNKLSKTSSK